jgi:hypothetical protein
LRRDLDPDMEVDVEILDVTDADARALLLSLDPLAALAETQTQLYQRLLELTPVQSPELLDFWQGAAEAAAEEKPARRIDVVREQYLLLVTCRDDEHHVELLQRFQGEGLPCKALLS